MSKRIRVGIVGGGLAGVITANALVKIPHLEVHVYESALEFSERGLGIGLSDLALQALDEIIPSAIHLLKTKAGAVATAAARVVIGSGSEIGAVVSDIGGDTGLAMNRAPLLRELVALLPGEILHAGKKLTSLEQTASGVTITFADGSTAYFDAVIGADGIFSTVREHVLQESAAKHAASPAGWWDSRNLVPIEKVKAVLGEESFEVDREYCWAGNGAFIMHALVENKTMVQCIITAVEKDFPSDRRRPLTREFLESSFASDWSKPLVQGMIELVLDQKDPYGYSQWEHKSTPTYANGRVCIIGDAAHSPSPWQGAGAGLVVEDALILGSLLRSTSSVGELEAAFGAFDAVRRPRCQGVVDSSSETGRAFCGQIPDVGVNRDRMGEAIGPLFASLYDINLEEHKRAAEDELQERLPR
ncbi:salicylate hydroxylase [Thozetella sp. PMI_491]|nr:salicylate hydroxylase [Thozetella sp. PMI_491]